MNSQLFLVVCALALVAGVSAGCPQSLLMTDFSGVLPTADNTGTDQTGPYAYCSWIIRPTGMDTTSRIRFHVEYNDEALDRGDAIAVYDAADSSDSNSLLLVHGAATAAQDTFSSGTVLYIKYVPKNAGTVPKFKATWNVEVGCLGAMCNNAHSTCSSGTCICTDDFHGASCALTPVNSNGQCMASAPTLTTATGEIYSTDPYALGSDCDWIITPTGFLTGDHVKLTFTKVHTEYGVDSTTGIAWDFISVYDGTSTADTKLAQIYGDHTTEHLSLAASPVLGSSGSLYVHFQSDLSFNAAGFVAYWEIVPKCTACADPNAVLHHDDCSCPCKSGYSGAPCQPTTTTCVPRTVPGSNSHSLAFVLDTSDSNTLVHTAVKQIVASMTSTLNFDRYLLSTWAYSPSVGSARVKTFPTAAGLAGELTTGGVEVNNLLPTEVGEEHNDWLYMMVQVNATLDAMGHDGVIVVVTDNEQICDVDPTVRHTDALGLTQRYPGNPHLVSVFDPLVVKAASLKATIYYVVFPSYAWGYCSQSQKTLGLDLAGQLTDSQGTDTPVGVHPKLVTTNIHYSDQAVSDITQKLVSVITDETGEVLCDCPSNLVKSTTDNTCLCPPGQSPTSTPGICA